MLLEFLFCDNFHIASTMSEEDANRRKLERLRAVRGGHSGVVTKLCKEANATLQNESCMADPTKVSRLTVISEQLNAKWKALSTLDVKIVSLCPLTEITGELNHSEPIEVKLLETKHKINSHVKKGLGEPASPSLEVSSESPAVNRQHLPKLPLSKFRGDVTQWSSFWDSFKSSVHNNLNLPVIDKMNYLNSLSEGTAAQTI